MRPGLVWVVVRSEPCQTCFAPRCRAPWAVKLSAHLTHAEALTDAREWQAKGWRVSGPHPMQGAPVVGGFFECL